MNRSRELLAWVEAHARGLAPGALTDRTPLLAARHLTSVQLPDLILHLEALRGRPIDVAALRPGDFRDLATIRARFLDGEGA